ERYRRLGPQVALKLVEVRHCPPQREETETDAQSVCAAAVEQIRVVKVRVHDLPPERGHQAACEHPDGVGGRHLEEPAALAELEPGRLVELHVWRARLSIPRPERGRRAVPVAEVGAAPRA